MSLRMIYRSVKGEWDQALQEVYEPIAEAGTAAIRDAAEMAKAEGRADIASAGFSKRWQNALRVDVFPRKKNSANAAAYIHHKIPYASIFEEGATIRGRPKLWLPLRNTPKKIGRNRMTPENFGKHIGQKLNYVERGGRQPLLAASVRLTRSNARRKEPKITQAALRRGANGDGVLRSVPLFVGVDSVRIRKRFSIGQIVENIANRLPLLYLRHFKEN